MSASHDEIAKPSHRRFRWQFGLRSLLGLTLAAGLLFAYAAHVRRQCEREYDREQPSIGAIAEIGGKCEMSARGSTLARWLSSSDTTSRVVAVDLSFRVTAWACTREHCIPSFSLQDRVTDSWMRHLAPLEHLEMLDLSGNPISGEGLAVIQNLSRLKTLDLSSCAVEDGDLAHLASLAELRSLRLEGAEVGDEGLRHLSALTSLLELGVGRAFEEAAADFRHAAPSLLELGIGRAFEVAVSLGETQEQPGPPKPAITIDGLRHLQALHHLEKLHLEGVTLSEAELEVLEALPNLRELDVDRSRLTPRAIERVRRWTGLGELRLSHSNQPEEVAAIRELKRARPELAIIASPDLWPDETQPSPSETGEPPPLPRPSSITPDEASSRFPPPPPPSPPPP